MTDRPYLFNLDRDQLHQLIAQIGMPAYRADQVLDWVYRKFVADPRKMTNLSTVDRDRLGEAIDFTRGHIVRHQQATDETQKLLLKWEGGSRKSEVGGATAHTLPTSDFPLPTSPTSECVMIPAESHASGKPRRTACISTQVGCPVGCRFCASGLGGLETNLTAGHIVEQVFHLNACLNPKPQASKPDTITHIVFMGMGEPLANFDATTRAVRLLMAEWGFNLSGRRITVSTVGLPAPMRRLADMGLPVTLAISLHAPNDALRRQLIPWAEHTPIEKIIDAGRYYFDRTGREVTLEYILLRGVNDRPQQAKQLADLSRQLRSSVNLIRYNEVAGLPYQRPDDEDVRRFQSILQKANVNVHIRASRGRYIAAACGQLRHEAATANGG